MSNPWDIPPVPQTGDATEDATFASVGRALSRWEAFDARLAVLFGVFMGTLIDTHEVRSRAAVRAYGSVVSFRIKEEMLDQAAKTWFDAHPSPELEKQFQDLLRLAGRYAARRNDIGHGIVHPLWRDGQLQQSLGYCLFAAPHNSGRTTLPKPEGPRYRSKYIYSSTEIDAFSQRFVELTEQAARLGGAIGMFISEVWQRGSLR